MTEINDQKIDTKSLYKIKEEFNKLPSGLYAKGITLIPQKQCEQCGFVGVGQKYGHHFKTNKHRDARFKKYMF